MKHVIFLSSLILSTTVFANDKIIIDQDTRVQITAQNRQRIHDSIGLLYLQMGKEGGICTGTVIGANHVVTAAHCLVKDGKLVTKVIFVPGLSDDLSKKKFPFGTFVASKLHVHPKYIGTPGVENDLGVVQFRENLPVSAINVAAAPAISNLPITITGYPGDKVTGTLWEGKGTRESLNVLSPLAHNVDTVAGQSGSAVRATINGVVRVIGVHSSGNRVMGRKFNTAHFFSNESLKLINLWIRSR